MLNNEWQELSCQRDRCNFRLVAISGQGHFGKVYTAINNETGDIMAMKEIPLQPNDHKTLRFAHTSVLYHYRLSG